MMSKENVHDFNRCGTQQRSRHRLATDWTVWGPNPGESIFTATIQTQLPIKWVPGLFPESEAAGAWC
jgi:hypothetical protein